MMHRIFKIKFMVRKIGDYAENILEYRAVCKLFYDTMRHSAVLKKRYGSCLFIDRKTAALYFGALANNSLLRYLNAYGYYMNKLKDYKEVDKKLYNLGLSRIEFMGIKAYMDCIHLAIIHDLKYAYIVYARRTIFDIQYFQHRFTGFIPLLRNKPRRDIIKFINFAFKTNKFKAAFIFNYGLITSEFDRYCGLSKQDIRFMLNILIVCVPNDIAILLINKILKLTNNTKHKNIISNFKELVNKFIAGNNAKIFTASDFVEFLCSHMKIPVYDWMKIAELILPIDSEYHTKNEINSYFKIFRKLLVISWNLKVYPIFHFIAAKIRSWYDHKKKYGNYDHYIINAPQSFTFNKNHDYHDLKMMIGVFNKNDIYITLINRIFDEFDRLNTEKLNNVKVNKIIGSL